MRGAERSAKDDADVLAGSGREREEVARVSACVRPIDRDCLGTMRGAELRKISVEI